MCLSECAVQIEVSMPSSSKTFFIHRATDLQLRNIADT